MSEASTLTQYVGSQVDLAEFERWFVPALRFVSDEERQLFADVDLAIAEFEQGLLTEEALKAELESLLWTPSP